MAIRQKAFLLTVIAAVLCGVLIADDNTPSSRHHNFSFSEVDVRTFVKAVGDMTEGRFRFIVDQDVKGTVTVVYPRVRDDEALAIFVSILDSIGCSVVEEQEGVYRVVALAPRAAPSAPVFGPGEETPAHGVITKIIQLKYVSADELQVVLQSKVPGGKEGAVGAIKTTNHIIVTDEAEKVRRIEKIVALVDKPDMLRATEVVTLEYASAEDVAQELSRAMTETASHLRQPSAKYARRSGSEQRPVVVASPHSNSLILVGSASQIMELKRIIGLMDVDSPSGRGNLRAIFLKYISAEEAAKSLNALLQKGVTKDGAAASAAAIAIEPHLANNALLVDAMPRDFDLVRELVEQLDRPPEQVLIEVLIVEVSLRDEMDIGVSVVALDQPASVGTTVIQGGSLIKEGATDLMNAIQSGLFPGGLTIGLAHGVSENADGGVASAFPAVLNIDAIRKDGRFNVRSNVRLQAQNNKEASVSIVNNIPVLTSTYSAGTGTARDIIQNIERIDVGIKLTLTPHINPGGEVLMTLNPSIEAVIEPGPVSDGLAPTIAKREISTTVSVEDGRTVVLSGLIREDRTETVRKVPILGSIPIIGWLFKHKVTGTEKTDLLVFVTPHIDTGEDASDMPAYKGEAGEPGRATALVGDGAELDGPDAAE